MKTGKKWTLLLLMMVSFVLTSCGKVPDVDSVLQNGATEFSQGKTEKDFALISSEEILNRLIDDFSGSRSEPDADELSDDEAKKIQDSTDDDNKIGGTGGDGTQPGDGSEPGGTEPGDGSEPGGTEPGDGSEPDGTEPEDGSEPDGTQPGNGTEEPEGPVMVASRDDLKKLMHQMFDETKEVLNFQCADGFTTTMDEITELYLEIEREDPIDAICLARYGYHYSGNSWMIFYEYHMDVDTLRMMKEETHGLLTEAVQNIDVTGLSDYEIVCAVNEYLCDTVEYPDAEPYAEETHTAYSAFKNGSAVCDGYSRAAKLLLNEFGVECDFVVGTCTNGGGHAWNLVKLDGQWYQLDVTWNDGSAEYDPNGRSMYLLVTDDYMKQSRTWDESVYPTSAAEAYAG